MKYHYAGVYTCEAFNDMGESFSCCTLVVRAGETPPLNYTAFPASATVAADEPAVFSAELDKVVLQHFLNHDFHYI